MKVLPAHNKADLYEELLFPRHTGNLAMEVVVGIWLAAVRAGRRGKEARPLGSWRMGGGEGLVGEVMG